MSDGLVYVAVGSDRFRAQMVTEACRAEGLRVELLTADASGVDPVIARLQEFRLLVAAGDADRVRAILRRSG